MLEREEGRAMPPAWEVADAREEGLLPPSPRPVAVGIPKERRDTLLAPSAMDDAPEAWEARLRPLRTVTEEGMLWPSELLVLGDALRGEARGGE
jgi:hypothetical protein